MDKETAKTILNTIPSTFENLLKTVSLGNDSIEGISGLTSILCKTFGEQLIEKVFEKQSKSKLDNLGFNTYYQGAIRQAVYSLENIIDRCDIPFTHEDVVESLKKVIEQQREKFNLAEVVIRFEPENHPVTVVVREVYINFLKTFGFTEENINKFVKDFNRNIEKRTTALFGDDYNRHLEDIEENWIKRHEMNYLIGLIESNSIGFSERDEDFDYEITYANWRKVSEFRNNSIDVFENELKPINLLIDEYFTNEEESYLNKILFIIADFGKGKSVFMKHYASKLAKNFLNTATGLFPVYINLRDYIKLRDYADSQYGIIESFLKDALIEITEPYYKKREYVFLLDSLDESGELNAKNIDEVISSIRKIQNLDTRNCLKNRIIIASRPFDDGLKPHLSRYNPHVIKNKDGRLDDCYISIYGFKKNQFNNFISTAVKKYVNSHTVIQNGLIRQISSEENFDIYQLLSKTKNLSSGELCRPIFAYMIYRLIINQVEMLEMNKIDIYLSFVNQLTREAKYVNDKEYGINLLDEFQFRNILHSIAALWMLKRQEGGQDALKKADICRAIRGRKLSENDKEVLNEYNTIPDVHFMSHSYFGENGDTQQFQHQSFAEILLAEYYLKIFIRYSFDEEPDIEEVRAKLSIGEPTEQTVEFLRELLGLLRQCSRNLSDKNITEKRKLLFPLMASLAIHENNTLYSYPIFYTWFRQVQINENETTYPEDALISWPITEQHLYKIVSIAKKILENKKVFTFSKLNFQDGLYNNEIAVFNKPLYEHSFNIDRWLALLVGNELYNDNNKHKYFNKTIDNNGILFDMIRIWNYTNISSAPTWGKHLFNGIDMKLNQKETDMSLMSLEDIDFSYSYLKNMKCCNSNLRGCRFHNVTFDNVIFDFSDITSSSIRNINIVEKLSLRSVILCPGVFLPEKLYKRFFIETTIYQPIVGGQNAYFGVSVDEMWIDSVMLTLYGLLDYIKRNYTISVEDLKRWFVFQKGVREHIKASFYQHIENITKSSLVEKEVAATLTDS